MKHNFFIGLGGSGGKIISALYKRLIDERGRSFESDVACIAIDTDQNELNKLSQLGVNKICISGDDTVGDYYNNLGGDVGEWCPNTSNEGIFFSGSVFGGASQCRLKSRLCLANFLKDSKNKLLSLLEESLYLDPTATVGKDKPPVVLIASSIAGGTGSGIFIQVALYIKKFFKDRGIDAVNVHGLFACPDLYKNAVSPQMLPNLYANAYAVIRELNAFNLICGPEKTSAYGGNIDLDIEISTDCEGRLFEKNTEGRYGDKPYDILYFIDKLNYLSKIIGDLPEYYDAMANIAYSHLYTDISERVWSNESNEMQAHNKAPSAIYGSAGAASMIYPYDDIVDYFAYRSLKDGIDSVWDSIDCEWRNYLKEKDNVARASGLNQYTPEPNEKAEKYVDIFEDKVKVTGITKTEFSFMANMVTRNQENSASALLTKLSIAAKNEIANDERIKKIKEKYLGNIDGRKNSILSKIRNNSKGDDTNIFWAIEDIDNNLDDYCKQGLTYAIDQSFAFANRIFCDDSTMWKSYDKSDIGIINALLKTEDKGEYIHPVAARYLLYKFKLGVDKKIESIIKDIDTPANDADDFNIHLNSMIVDKQRKVLKASKSESNLSNKKILENRLKRIRGKKATLENVSSYFSSLSRKLEETDDVFANALLYFSLLNVRERLVKLITNYEIFFDKLDDFSSKITSAINVSEKKHELSRGNVFVCASAKIKDEMYNDCANLINTKSGASASSISKALFDTMRQNAESSKSKSKNKAVGVDALFESVSSIVAESIKDSAEIQNRINMNAFRALVYEYELTYPENTDDISNYANDDASKNRIDQFVSGKFKNLAQMAAPFLAYDITDTYSGMFTETNGNGVVSYTKPAVTNFYRYISYNPANDKAIRELTSTSNHEFFGVISSDLPKDTKKQTVKLETILSNKVDPYTILCYSTVHCLQPYQIKAFDELNGGVYFDHYSKRIAEMEALQCYSMSPHLDKRWHKHSVMPYINVRKEAESRLELAKAFLFAVTFGRIAYDVEGSDARLVYGDSMLNRDYKVIIHRGKSIPYFRLNRVMSWFADEEVLVGRYSSMFDVNINAEIEKLSKYGETVGDYKKGITNYAKILNRLKKNILQNVEVDAAKNGKTKTVKKKDPLSLLDFAWSVHTSEETENDKDYGELLVETLCGVLRDYAKAPYNADAISKKDTGNAAYMCYVDVLGHLANKFMEEFICKIEKDIKTSRKTEEPKKKPGFGRADETDELSEEPVVKVSENLFNFDASEAVKNDKRFIWASSLFNKYLY